MALHKHNFRAAGEDGPALVSAAALQFPTELISKPASLPLPQPIITIGQAADDDFGDFADAATDQPNAVMNGGSTVSDLARCAPAYPATRPKLSYGSVAAPSGISTPYCPSRCVTCAV